MKAQSVILLTIAASLAGTASATNVFQNVTNHVDKQSDNLGREETTDRIDTLRQRLAIVEGRINSVERHLKDNLRLPTPKPVARLENRLQELHASQARMEAEAAKLEVSVGISPEA